MRQIVEFLATPSPHHNMKRVQVWRWLPMAILLALVGTPGGAEEFRIQTFNNSGQIVFGAVTGATNYQVKMAPTPTGVWSVAVGTVPPTAANSLTTTVVIGATTVFYGVVAYTNVLPPPPQDMVQIPAGTNSGTDPELGIYSLTNAEAFFMDANEVNKAKWDEVYTWAVSNGYLFDNKGLGKASEHPVYMVNWYDCVKWCNARSQKEGRTPCYTIEGNVYKTGQSAPDCNSSANGYRLPTKSEWEYAARGGLSGKRFPCGDTITHSQANYYSWDGYSYDVSPTRGYHPTYSADSAPYTNPVGSLVANGYGLHNMAGNLREWCGDGSGYYQDIRGGCHSDYAWALRCGYSNSTPLSNASNYIGFRSICR